LRVEVHLPAIDAEPRLANLCLALFDRGLRRPGIEPHQELIAFDLIALLHEDFRHAARDLRRQRHLAFVGQRSRGEHGRRQRAQADRLDVDCLLSVVAGKFQPDRYHDERRDGRHDDPLLSGHRMYC
jgi:hypothetical protein